MESKQTTNKENGMISDVEEQWKAMHAELTRLDPALAVKFPQTFPDQEMLTRSRNNNVYGGMQGTNSFRARPASLNRSAQAANATRLATQLVENLTDMKQTLRSHKRAIESMTLQSSNT